MNPIDSGYQGSKVKATIDKSEYNLMNAIIEIF